MLENLWAPRFGFGSLLRALPWRWERPGLLGAGSIAALLPEKREQEGGSGMRARCGKLRGGICPSQAPSPRFSSLRQAGMKESSRLWSSCDPGRSTAPVTLPGGSDREPAALRDIPGGLCRHLGVPKESQARLWPGWRFGSWEIQGGAVPFHPSSWEWSCWWGRSDPRCWRRLSLRGS